MTWERTKQRLASDGRGAVIDIETLTQTEEI